MPDSARGESITRSSPKSFCRPSVIRKTPPSLPTSSPMITTLPSLSMALRRPSLSAFAMVMLVTGALMRPPPELPELPEWCVPRRVVRYIAPLAGDRTTRRTEERGRSCGHLRDELGELLALRADVVGHRHVDEV